jgi:glycosyltransferase involved in cell wall biosynthesis
MELPVVAFRATGVVDAVEDGTTGTLVPLGEVDAFGDALVKYLRDLSLRREHGRAGRERVLRLFRQETVWQVWHDFYVELLRERGMRVPESARSVQSPAPASAEQATQP